MAEDGQSIDHTFGRRFALEAYTRGRLEHRSWEAAVLDYSRTHGRVSGNGDSGAAIFNAEGKLVAILHSGMPRGMSSHVTFGTPGHYVVELIRERYPHADLECRKYDA